MHTEGYPGGEFKHGQITLFDDQIVAVVSATCDVGNPDSKARYRQSADSAAEMSALSSHLVALVTEGDQRVSKMAEEATVHPGGFGPTVAAFGNRSARTFGISPFDSPWTQSRPTSKPQQGSYRKVTSDLIYKKEKFISHSSHEAEYASSVALKEWDFRRSWESVQRSRFAGLHFHDLGRTAARNMRRGHVSGRVATEVGGRKTTAVFHHSSI